MILGKTGKLFLISLLPILFIRCATTSIDNTEYYGAKFVKAEAAVIENNNLLHVSNSIELLENSDINKYSFTPNIFIRNAPPNFNLFEITTSRNDLSYPVVVTGISEVYDSPSSGADVRRIETTGGSVEILDSDTSLGGIVKSISNSSFAYLLAGPYWSFTPPAKILRDASDLQAHTVRLALRYQTPKSYSFSPKEALPGHHLPSQVFEIPVWNIKKVIQNYFHSGVKLTVLDARSLTPIRDAEVLLREHNLPAPEDKFLEAYKSLAGNLNDLGLPAKYISQTGAPGEFLLFPYLSSEETDSVNVLIRHPNYEPFQGVVHIEEENQEWEILMPRIGQRIEVDDAPELNARIRKRSSGN